MPDFTALLKQSIDGINQGYQQAAKDLNEVIADLNRAVQDYSQGAAQVRLTEASRDFSQTTFTLLFTGKQKNRPIGFYRITPTGYPMVYGDNASNPSSGQLNSRVDLERHVADMLTDQNSSLIVNLAYTLRG